jgi:hypothetical protein
VADALTLRQAIVYHVAVNRESVVDVCRLVDGIMLKPSCIRVLVLQRSSTRPSVWR